MREDVSSEMPEKGEEEAIVARRALFAAIDCLFRRTDSGVEVAAADAAGGWTSSYSRCRHSCGKTVLELRFGYRVIGFRE
jgi:hypothetical protein